MTEIADLTHPGPTGAPGPTRIGPATFRGAIGPS